MDKNENNENAEKLVKMEMQDVFLENTLIQMIAIKLIFLKLKIMILMKFFWIIININFQI